MSATFLLELLTEEIPANALPSARQQLADGLREQLEAAHLSGFSITVFSTSRRLVVRIARLPLRQPDREERLLGPPKSVAFAADGTPTKAAEGFARKAGVALDRLEVESTPKGEYLAATVTHLGKPTAEVLAEAVLAAVSALRFPKTMRWGQGEHTFVRPLHSVVALLDAEVVPLSLFGVASGRRTVGHRVHAPKPFTVSRAKAYFKQLERRAVVIDPAARRTHLEEAAAALAAEVGCTVRPDPELVAEHVELVEHPGLLRGAFDPAFLELPQEIVVTTLRHHQKCLALLADGALAAGFLTVVDRRDDPAGEIRQGNEWVIRARLADARFFFEEDRKHPLAELVPQLERIELHRKLGTLAAKATRVGDLAATLAAELSLGLAEELIRSAAPLVKTDLASHVVGEFPELQGVIGGHYLRLEGAGEELWTAAADHYRPQGFDGELPRSTLGRLLAAADRADTLAGLFSVGEVPSGSRDPYGLRRAAQGLVRILAESGWEVDLGALVRRAVGPLATLVGADPAPAVAALDDFLADRVRRYLTDVVSVAGDTAEAVMAARPCSLPELVARARALEAVRGEPELRSLVLAFRRVRNITDGQPDTAVAVGLLSEPAEQALAKDGETFHRRLEELLPGRRLEEGFRAMAPLAATLDRFFIEVLVMTDDERVRANRIALLKSLGRDFLALADLSRLQTEGGEG